MKVQREYCSASKIEREPIFHSFQNYAMDVRLGNKGLVIKISTIKMIENQQILYYCVSDETLSEQLRKRFQTIDGLFRALQHKQLLQVDPRKQTLRIKILKIQDNVQFDNSITLKLQHKKLEVNSFTLYYLRQQNMKNRKFNIFYLLPIIITILCSIMYGSVWKTNQIILKQNQGNRILINDQIIHLIEVTVAKRIHNQTYHMQNEFKQKMIQSMLKVDKLTHEIGLIKQKNSSFISNLELENFFQKFTKLSTSLQQRLKSQMSFVNKTIKDHGNQIQKAKIYYDSLHNNLNKTKLQLSTIQKMMKDHEGQRLIYDKNMNDLQSKLRKIEIQMKEMYKKTDKVNKQQGDNEENDSWRSSFKNIEIQLDQLTKVVKKLTIFDMTSKYIESFNIQQNQVTYNALSGRYTQIMLQNKISFDKKEVYNFSIQASQSNSILIGIVDSVQCREQRSSILYHTTIAYNGRGELWKDGTKIQENNTGFVKGDLVTMEVQLSKGIIRWMVNQQIVKEVISEKLQNNFINFRAYIQMSVKGDSVKIVKTN